MTDDYDIVLSAIKYASDWGDLVDAPHEWPEVRAALSRIKARERDVQGNLSAEEDQTAALRTQLERVEKQSQRTQLENEELAARLERYERALREARAVALDFKDATNVSDTVFAMFDHIDGICRRALSEPSQGMLTVKHSKSVGRDTVDLADAEPSQGEVDGNQDWPTYDIGGEG